MSDGACKRPRKITFFYVQKDWKKGKIRNLSLHNIICWNSKEFSNNIKIYQKNVIREFLFCNYVHVHLKLFMYRFCKEIYFVHYTLVGRQAFKK